MKKVIITGGCGFIGGHLSKYLAGRGFEVHVIDNLRSGFINNIEGINNLVFHEETIENREAILEISKDAEYIFNMAAMVSVPESVEKPFECVSINVKGILNLLEAAKTHSIKKVVHSSSAAIYGDDPKMPKTYDMLPQPKTPYAITKLDGEYYLRAYQQEYNFQTTSLRYFNVFGPNQNPKSQYAAAVPIFISKAINNEDIIIYGDGEQTRDFIFVTDVVKANYLAATGNSKGVYNIANGISTSINDIAKKIIAKTESKSKIIYKPERTGDIKHSLACINKTKKDLNFEPEISIDKGLDLTIEYFKNF